MAKLSFCKKMPSKVGRSCLTPLISVFGGVAGDATVTRISNDEFWVVSSGISERYQQRFYNCVRTSRKHKFSK